MKQTKRKKNEEGWTFMETLVVIAIVLILTSSVGFMAIQYLDKARVATAKSQIDSFSVALESYYIDCGRYPTAEQGLSALWKKPQTEPSSDTWSGPYLYKQIPDDPWGNPYEYSTDTSDGIPYIIRSFGADGREGGEANDADITS
jgi:general secretion pathway protein G